VNRRVSPFDNLGFDELDLANWDLKSTDLMTSRNPVLLEHKRQSNCWTQLKDIFHDFAQKGIWMVQWVIRRDSPQQPWFNFSLD